MTDNVTTSGLAYVGDAVFELIVRERLATSPEGEGHPGTYALKYVTAEAQSAALGRIEEYLTPEEEAVYKRGRNCVHGNVPKHASPADYRRATGLEALMGHLWLTGQFDRARELFGVAFPMEGNSESTKEE